MVRVGERMVRVGERRERGEKGEGEMGGERKGVKDRNVERH